MHSFEKSQSPEFLALDKELALGGVKSDALLDNRVLSLDHEWFSISSTADGMGAIQAEILEDLLTDLLAGRVRRERTRVIQFAFGHHGGRLGRVKGENVLPMSHDERAESVHQHPWREEEAAEHMNPANQPGDDYGGHAGFGFYETINGGRRIH
jgi:hypothetical protein